MTSPTDVFLKPQSRGMRRYEALRARFVEGCPTVEAAKRFGYAPGTFRNLCSEFLANPHWDFFEPPEKPAATGAKDSQTKTRRDARILDLRKAGLSIHVIADRLKADGISVCASTVANVLRQNGISKLPRQPVHPLTDIIRPETAAVADVKQLDLSPQSFRTQFGGLFLFLPLLESIGLDDPVNRHRMPGSTMIPAPTAFRALLALKP